LTRLKERLREFREFGIPHLLVVDPYTREVQRFERRRLSPSAYLADTPAEHSE
jgi:hypothetical protein